jgi:hypothetical protein
MTLRCLVPHCPRTRRGDPNKDEWICPTHFRRVDPEVHRLYNAAHARAVTAEKAPGPIDAPAKLAVFTEVTELWERCKAQALARLHLAH